MRMKRYAHEEAFERSLKIKALKAKLKRKSVVTNKEGKYYTVVTVSTYQAKMYDVIKSVIKANPVKDWLYLSSLDDIVPDKTLKALEKADLIKIREDRVTLSSSNEESDWDIMSKGGVGKIVIKIGL